VLAAQVASADPTDKVAVLWKFIETKLRENPRRASFNVCKALFE
jgi:hypothetical protein